ncbi:trypsin-like peptidase domain-containing protein [Prosthecobacter sp.]|uniref:trypsin-like peptidase domain-containing protein n=1 Tax=Prosthecobacter sp. TaxID=1965333 RepID=UPI003784DED1
MKKSLKPIPCFRRFIQSMVGTCVWSGLALCHAQEVTSQLEVPGAFGKKVYQNVKVMAVTPQGVKIVHDAGISVVPAASLPKEWLAKFAPEAAAMPTAPKEEARPAEKPVETAPPPAAGTSSAGTAVSSFDPSSLVFIKTANGDATGNGSGFIARANGKTYVYTNAHVLCGEIGSFTTKILSIKTASGRIIPTPFELELSEMQDGGAETGLEDLARFPVTLSEGESAYEISELDPNTAMNSRIIAYGNSLGGDVITSLPGNILGLGTDRIEMSCEIVPGNSGGPVVLEQSKKVIGISTYLVKGKGDIWARNTKWEQMRRFAMRPDKVTKWRRMQYTALMSSTAELSAFHRDTLSLAAASYLNPKPNNAGFDVSVQSKGDFELRKVLTEGSRHSLGRSITGAMSKVNQRLTGSFGGNKAMMSAQGVRPYFAEFFATVAQASSSQMQSMQNADRAPYLKQFIPELIRIRTEYHNLFLQQAARFK